MKSVFTVVLILMLGGWATFAQTDGFTVLTTETARRTRIAQHPVEIPTANVWLAAGQTADLGTALAADQRVAIVNFMFTRCISVCLAMGTEFQQLQNEIKSRGLEDRVRLVSISFDPDDTPKWLARYQDRMDADPDIWQAVSVVDDAERQALLDTFGIVVVPAPLGQFEHNTAYHVVTPAGRLARIVDINKAAFALHYALEQTKAPALAFSGTPTAGVQP